MFRKQACKKSASGDVSDFKFTARNVFCSGLLHVSKITRGQLRSVSDVLEVGERVKALVIKSTAPNRIALRYTRIYF